MSDNTRNEPDPMSHKCPVCAAEPNQPCRTRGDREAKHSHVRRLLLVDEWLQRRALPVRALCCECGNLRTVSANYSPPRDENRTTDGGDEPHGWRMTGTVKCGVCKTRTRHAILCDDCPEYRDAAEERECRQIVGQRQQLQELSNEELLEFARLRVYELVDNVMKTVPLGDLTMQECSVVLDAFKQIADNHL